MDIEKELEMALKDITTDDLGPTILNPQRYAAYVKGLMRPESILSDIRFQAMESNVELIDRVIAPERVLRRLSEGTAATGSDVTFKQISVTATPLIGYIPMYDPALRRNLERGDFTNTLIDLLVQATRRDIEDYVVFARTDSNDASGDILLSGEGFIRQAVMANGDATTGNVDNNILYGVNSASGVDPDFDAAIDKNNIATLLDKMIGAVPEEYFINPSDFKFYVPFDVAEAYRDFMGGRDTATGDMAITSAELPPYKGIPVKYAPVLNQQFPDDGDAVLNAFETPIILAQPNNLIFGLFREIKVEQDREAKAARTDFVVQVEPAAGIEVPEAVVVALPNADKNAADDLFATT